MRAMRGRVLFCGAWVVIATVVAACAPAPAPAPPPSSPVIQSFRVVDPVTPAPALVAATWVVAGPAGVQLTCRVDVGADGTDEWVVPGCAGPGSRNLEFATAGVRTVRLAVDAPGFPRVTSEVQVDVRVGSAEPYNIAFRYAGSPTAGVQAAFESAKARWERVVVRGVPDLASTFGLTPCLDASPPLPASIDDVLVDVIIEPIDGVNGILGEAGPCVVGSQDFLPRVGVIRFDSADVQSLLSAGRFEDVVLHELGHVLGFGGLWLFKGGLVVGSGTADPRYVGARGAAEWHLLGGVGGVPVENTGGPGTRDAHWREVVLGNELMTGYLNNGVNPLSRLSIAAMADLGYRVDPAEADPYALPVGGASLRRGEEEEPGEVLRPEITVAG